MRANRFDLSWGKLIQAHKSMRGLGGPYCGRGTTIDGPGEREEEQPAGRVLRDRGPSRSPRRGHVVKWQQQAGRGGVLVSPPCTPNNQFFGPDVGEGP